ncbi:PEP-CTERM system TPR-repeat protein PrsT [Pseudoduganella sp. LjRoot289]|uniref:XrtA/PEP-CTERM system TPR-repeat protein PrsT n=1 Tax=Pseudoduganella sp. LjRoot289 TaxID=3342314 RepID=UPI003ECCDD59
MAVIGKKRLLGVAVTSSALLVALLGGCAKKESPATLMAEAKQFQSKGDNQAAQIQLKNLLAANPEDGEARYLLARTYVELGDALAAEKEVRKALSLKFPPAQALPVLARALLMQGQFQKVLDETAEEAKQNGAELLCARADALLSMGKRDEAKEVFTAVVQREPANPAALTGLGRVAFLMRDGEGAMRYADQAVAAAPKNPDVLMFKADLLRAQNKPEQALAAYDQVLVANSAHRSAHIEKAYLEIAAGKYEAAQADLAAAKKTTPNSLMVTYTQALLDFTQGKNAAAQESLQKVLRAAPEHMPSILLAGAVDLNLGSVQQAEQHLRKYLEKNPDNLYARKMLASTLLRSGQTPDALAVLAPALKTAQPDVQLLALAGESYMQARDFNKATEYFEKASTLEPKAASLRTSLGLSKLGKGERAEAISDLELATTLDSKSAQAGIALVRTELGMRNFDKALAAIAKLEQNQPASAVVGELKGAAYLGKGDIVAARAAYEKSLVLQPNYFPSLVSLVQLDLTEKKPEDAKKRLQAYLVKEPKSIDAMSALAGVAASVNQPAEATSWLEKAVEARPEAVQPGMRLAMQYLRTDQAQKALLLARKLQVANPANAELLDLLAQCQLANKDPAAALESYSKLAGLVPKSALAQFRLAGVHAQMKNEAAAADDLKKALQLQPDFPQAQLMQAELLVRQNKPDAALAVARQLQKQHAKLPGGYVLEADVLALQGKHAATVPVLEKALSVQKSPALAVKLIEALKRSGKTKEAEQRVASWLKDNPNDSMVAMYQAESSLATKQYVLAIGQFEAILKQLPKNPVVLNNLAQAYLSVKDSRALGAAEAAEKLAPNHPAIVDTLGWVLVEQGNVERGLPLLRKAAGAAAGNPEIHYHLAAALSKSGDKAGARKELEQLLAGGKTFPQADEAKALLKQL